MIKNCKIGILIFCNILLILVISEMTSYIAAFNTELKMKQYNSDYNMLLNKITEYEKVLDNYEIISKNGYNYEYLVDEYNKEIDELNNEINDLNDKIQKLKNRIKNF